jgi:hypothetical protein
VSPVAKTESGKAVAKRKDRKPEMSRKLSIGTPPQDLREHHDLKELTPPSAILTHNL